MCCATNRVCSDAVVWLVPCGDKHAVGEPCCHLMVVNGAGRLCVAAVHMRNNAAAPSCHLGANILADSVLHRRRHACRRFSTTAACATSITAFCLRSATAGDNV
ncbi:hypothetical protein AVEN_39588-1 [Araneus ventricosus]|uniref:Uncharacterized protein n=1 Tax=Araneus ventricosus TaxID=182803 RepID=A0A4Y2HKW2_ARAVE|nr:hypothetical protein AVEN_39588-1 [Araneus ventricosus]